MGLCPDHGGLVQLCRWKGCINKVNMERRGGMCWMHREDTADSDNSEEEESEDDGEIRLCSVRGCISEAACGGLCEMHSTTYEDDCLDQDGEKEKRSLPSWDTANNNEPTIKRRRQRKSFVIDLSDVPPQPPIPKNKLYVKEGASKYTGVSFNKQSNKWTAQIMVEGKHHTIGRRYDNEEEAAVDYARALFKYKGGVKDREQRDSFAIDLSGVPSQPPIPKSSGRIKEGASKYTGLFLNQQRYKWVAQIRIEGRLLLIGYYDDEEEAAVDYARAVFKYKGGVVHPR